MSEQPASQYAELLRQLRAERGLTQEELAAAAGISPRTVSDLERGINQTPRRATAELLADALELSAPQREQFMAAARRRPAAPPGPALGGAGTPPDANSAGSAADADGFAGDADASNVVWIESAASAAFVDREEELGALREAWSSAKAGHRVLTLIAGEPGIGKTALTAELARLVSEDGGLVLYGRWDEHVPAPYQAFREALNDYARACPDALLRHDLAGLAEEIARLCPEPAHRVGASAAPAAAAQTERFRLFESIDTWIGRIAARRPVLLVLDDLQWADQPSFFLLPHLMRARRSTPLLTVAMYRDLGPERSEFSAALPSLTRDIDCRRVSLRGLEHHAVTTLLEDAVGRPFRERESGMVAELEWETAGNPFFLLEMARHLSEVGAFDRDVVRLGETPAEIPQSIRDMVRSRLRRLTPGCVETLAVAALIGERFEAGLLASAASLTDAQTVDRLEEAARAGLIAEIDDEPDHWRFSHSLTRRVTSEELSRGRRSVFHQRIGDKLEYRPGVAAAELAHHFGAAANRGSAQKAVRYGRLAGQRALEEVAAEVAVRHFRKALELLDRFGPEDQGLRCELLLDLAGAHDRAGEYAYRDERFAEAADTARRHGSDDLFARAALGYGGVLPASVRPDLRAQALLEEALTRLDSRDDATRATILARLAHWLHNVRPYPERLELSDRSVAMARRAQDRRTLATVLLHRCWALDGPGDVGDSATVAGEILKIGAELGDPALTLEGLRIQLAAQFENGRHAAAVQTAKEMKTLAEAAGHPE
ncbi:MAG TPA: AAA family ATPase, partial [Trebonia sp.]